MTQPQNPQQPYGGQPVGGQPVGQPHQVPAAAQAGMAHGAPQTETTQTTQTTTTTATPGYNGIPPVDATPSTPKQGNRILRIILPILGLIVVSTLIGCLPRLFDDNNFMKTGQCVTVDNGKDFKKVECNANKAGSVTYTVGKVGDSSTAKCTTEDYYQYTYNVNRRRGADTHKYACLVPNFKENTCYVESGGSSNTSIKEAACGTTDAVRVVKKISEANAKCESGQVALNYPDEKITYCVAPK